MKRGFRKVADIPDTDSPNRPEELILLEAVLDEKGIGHTREYFVPDIGRRFYRVSVQSVNVRPAKTLYAHILSLKRQEKDEHADAR